MINVNISRYLLIVFAIVTSTVVLPLCRHFVELVKFHVFCYMYFVNNSLIYTMCFLISYFYYRYNIWSRWLTEQWNSRKLVFNEYWWYHSMFCSLKLRAKASFSGHISKKHLSLPVIKISHFYNTAIWWYYIIWLVSKFTWQDEENVVSPGK